MLATLFVMAIMTSCGADTNEVTLKIEPQLGDLGSYVDVMDKEVVVTLSDVTDDDGVKVKKIASSISISVKKAVASDYGFALSVKVLDKNHVEIADLSDISIDDNTDYQSSGLNYYVMPGNVRAQLDVETKSGDWTENMQKKWEEVCKNGVYLQLKPKEYAKFSPYSKSDTDSEESSVEDSSSDSEDEVASSNTSSGEDWDSVLDSYESYVNKYVSLMKKANAGDASAMSEYPSMMQEAQELSEKLSNAQGELSSAQVARYLKITKKMSKI